MPQVQYVNQIRGINSTAGMPTPKRITELRYWLKTAQLHLKDIPREIAESVSMVMSSDPLQWYVIHSDVTERWIKFTIENGLGEKAHVVIDRKKSMFDR